ncbi:hypothetical protein BRADI_3g38514v3 [Brachypodium distachyon]|uniref:Uncharacterized protein n=1 Tax=Brachypodium distachyon TaxID=15368 RepID=A0A2K2D214_BRADI|nr:hypothetical protein BRADI_3g38514v3 [Brachypodium distachyon]
MDGEVSSSQGGRRRASQAAAGESSSGGRGHRRPPVAASDGSSRESACRSPPAGLRRRLSLGICQSRRQARHRHGGSSVEDHAGTDAPPCGFLASPLPPSHPRLFPAPRVHPRILDNIHARRCREEVAQHCHWKLRHRRLANLIGYCCNWDECLLVVESMRYHWTIVRVHHTTNFSEGH